MNQSDPSTGISDSLGDAVSRLVDSLLRVGVSLAGLPLTLLPAQSRRHFEDGGRDIGKGVASILRAVADQIEGSRKTEKF